MNHREDHWIHQQLEPTDVIITGNYKREKELPGWLMREPDFTEAEKRKMEEDHERQQEEYLRKKGII